ncbi:MAG: prepilin-type N-terminal cleavage/methylation domain-containing protein [Clostridium sp.]
MNKLKKRRKGFTLIEMVVVIAIVVIIAAIAIPQALKAINKSKASTDVANARTYAGELMSKVANGEIPFPTTTPGADTDVPNAATPKLKGEKFQYQFDKENGNEIVKIKVTKADSAGAGTVVIYPTAASPWSDYVK